MPADRGKKIPKMLLLCGCSALLFLWPILAHMIPDIMEDLTLGQIIFLTKYASIYNQGFNLTWTCPTWHVLSVLPYKLRIVLFHYLPVSLCYNCENLLYRLFLKNALLDCFPIMWIFHCFTLVFWMKYSEAYCPKNELFGYFEFLCCYLMVN